jgi:hypothetical protein
MTASEQAREGALKQMSGVLWDVFTGSAPYKDVLARSCHPGFVGRLAWHLVAGNAGAAMSKAKEHAP